MLGSSQRLWRRLSPLSTACAMLMFATVAFAQAPAGYYDSANGLTGDALADAVHTIIKDHTRFPYTSSSTDTWDIIALADEDPNNANNVITIYKNQPKPKNDHNAGSGWNREHTWPKSLGFPDDSECNYPYTDTHHLMAADWDYNSARSNKPYDNCDVGCTEYPALNASSSNWTDGSFTSGVWEPYDDVKGDLARAMFYMAVRYNGGTHGITGCAEPDLRLTDNMSLVQNTSGNAAVGYMGRLSTLLAWAAADPVDGYEMAHNDIVFSFQGNRNPFIDHPEWIQLIFGGGNGNGGTNQGGGGGGTPEPTLWINEVHYDNSGADLDEGVEVAGPAGSGLTGWQLVSYDGATGTMTGAITLSGSIPNQQNSYGTSWFALADLGDGAPDGVALVSPSGAKVQFLSWEGSFTAVDGPASGRTSIDIGVSESGADAAGLSLQLTGTGTAYASFTWQPAMAHTNGAKNTNQTFGTGGGGGGGGGGGTTANVWINEIHYDNNSTDSLEGVEIAGRAGSDLSGYTLVAYNGSGGASYSTTALSGTLAATSGAYGFAWFAIAGLQNGSPDGIALVDPTGAVVQFLSYEGSFAATDGPATGTTSTDIAVSEASTAAVGSSLQLGGHGTSYADFTWQASQAHTNGAVNANQTFPTIGTLWINEIHYDNAGTDSGEGVEVAGPAGTSLDGWQLVGYNGNGGGVYNTTDLSGTLGDDTTGFGFHWVPIIGLQNGSPDGIALVNPLGEVVQFLSYEGAMVATDGPANGMTAIDIGVSETSSSPVDFSLQLAGDGTTYDAFSWRLAATGTPGEVNNDQTFDGSGGGGGGGGGQTGTGALWINEIHYDNAGTDSGEGVEIAGPAGTIMTGWKLVAYNGTGGALYGSVDLAGTLSDQVDGFGFAFYAIEGLQNGSPDGIALINPDGQVVQFLSYEGSFTAADGPAAGLTSTDIVVSEDSATSAGFSLQLAGTGREYADFVWEAANSATYDALNLNQMIEVPVVQETPWINELHYDNASTDFDEGVEIAGPAGLDLTGWTLVGYNGANGASYATVSLGGVIDDEQFGYGALWFNMAGLQNGSPDGVALVDPTGTVVQFLSYEGSFTAVDGPAATLVSTDIGVAEASTATVGTSLQLIGEGTEYAAFSWNGSAAHSRGDLNPGQSFGTTVADADMDGVADADDACPSSNIAATVAINGCETGVVNGIDVDGCSLSDRIASCGAGNPSRWAFVQCVTALCDSLVAHGELSSAERNAIVSCASAYGLPTANPDSYTTNWSTTLVVGAPGVLANDTDPEGNTLEAHLLQGPSRGSLSLARDGSFRYVPVAGTAGPVTFVYKAWDGSGYRTATVTIEVTPGNQAPITGNDNFTMTANTRLSVPAPGVLANDTDPEGTTLVAYLYQVPSVGKLGFSGDGSFWYEPPVGYTGTVSFIYRASDGLVKTAGTVTIQVNP